MDILQCMICSLTAQLGLYNLDWYVDVMQYVLIYEYKNVHMTLVYDNNKFC